MIIGFVQYQHSSLQLVLKNRNAKLRIMSDNQTKLTGLLELLGDQDKVLLFDQTQIAKEKRNFQNGNIARLPVT